MKTISIVEDSKQYQEAILFALKGAEGFVIADIFDNAEDAVNLFLDPPDIAIVDIQLPGMSGIELIQLLCEKNISTNFLVCSINDDDESIFKALKSGASGYILKDSSRAEIIGALTEVLNGGAPMSPYIARRVIRSFHMKPQKKQEILTDRENEILKLLATGLQYKEISANLGISHETVKKHLKNIYQKMHVQNKVEAINKFRSL